MFSVDFYFVWVFYLKKIYQLTITPTKITKTRAEKKKTRQKQTNSQINLNTAVAARAARVATATQPTYLPTYLTT